MSYSGFASVDGVAPNLATSTRNGDPFRVDVAKLGATPSTDANPLYDMSTTRANQDKTRAQGSFHASYRPNDWASLEANYGYDRSTDDLRHYRPKNFFNVALVPQGGDLALTNTSDVAQNASFTGALTRTFGTTNAIFRASYLY